MKQRNFGLDILRASAILFVVFNHICNYFVTFPQSTVLGDIGGVLGVEIFFVLSGFLIGRILMREFDADINSLKIKHFYMRRWFRTLPLYYFILAVLIVGTIITTQTFDFHLTHFVFLQNFSHEELNFFGVSWSLAIEEWFYLTIPLILWAGYKLKLITKKSMLFLILLVSAIMIARVLYVIYVPSATFDDIRKSIIFRFDSLLIGVIIAGIKLHVNKLYMFIRKPIFAAIAFVLMLGLIYKYTRLLEIGQLNTDFGAKAFGLIILSVLIGIILTYFETSKVINETIRKHWALREFVTWTSLLSYSIYLIHVSIFEIFRGIFPPNPQSFIGLACALVVTTGVSYLLFRYIETPFMNLRNKFAKPQDSELRKQNP
jgi:peptidoglycan/LPS O-acetylase OafA/YrhL